MSQLAPHAGVCSGETARRPGTPATRRAHLAGHHPALHRDHARPGAPSAAGTQVLKFPQLSTHRQSFDFSNYFRLQFFCMARVTALTKLSSNYQVVVPKSVRLALGLKSGDLFEATATRDGVLLR